ncbi:hypothetical protein J6590_076389 [Homalodisca vitripennis]|nr:hypothetical protein J6590_076389 [Homalodisca vitripennis]
MSLKPEIHQPIAPTLRLQWVQKINELHLANPVDLQERHIINLKFNASSKPDMAVKVLADWSSLQQTMTVIVGRIS